MKRLRGAKTWTMSVLQRRARQEGGQQIGPTIRHFGEAPKCRRLFVPGDAQFLHPRLQRGWLQAQELGRATLTTNAPTDQLHDVQNVVSLNLLECLSVGPCRSCLESWQFRSEHRIRVRDQESFDHIAQFTDISRPVVFLEGLHGRALDGLDGASHSLAKIIYQMPDRRRDVFLPVAQRSKRDSEDVAP